MTYDDIVKDHPLVAEGKELYKQGEIQKAEIFFWKAFDDGCYDGIEFLIHEYYEGRKVKKDKEKAIELAVMADQKCDNNMFSELLDSMKTADK